MRDVPCGCGLMPRGSLEEAGKGGGLGQTRPFRRGRKEVSVKELSSTLRQKKGSTVRNLLENFYIRCRIYFDLGGGGLVLKFEQR